MPSDTELRGPETQPIPRKESPTARWDNVVALTVGFVVCVVAVSIWRPSLALPLIMVVVLAALILLGSIVLAKLIGLAGRRTSLGRRVKAYFAPPPPPDDRS